MDHQRVASPSKRLLLVDLGNVTGGVEVYLRRLAEMLAPTVHMYCICVLPETARDLQNRNVHAILLPQIGRWTKPVAFIVTFFLLPYLVYMRRVDCVQVNGFLEAVFLLEARILGKTAIYTRHGPFEDKLYKWYRQPRRYYPRLVARIFARAASDIVCVSSDTYDSLEERLKARSVVIPHWLEIENRRHPINPPRTKLRILCVSRLERYKGVQLAIEAIRTIPDVELRVIGEGNYRQDLERLAKDLDVHFHGFQHDPSVFFATSDIFVMPSFGPEGSSIVALEAMAHALPCILSNLPVYREISGDGEAALHFECGDPSDLREKLVLLLQNPTLRSRYAQAACTRIRQVHNPAAAKWAYCQLIGVSCGAAESFA